MMNNMNIVPWTKLQKDSLWLRMESKYNIPNGRIYHNINHVIQLYEYAEMYKIPYDINLDVAILFHDVIYDSSDNKEIRSAYEFANIVKNFSKNSIALPEKVMFPFGVVEVNTVNDIIFSTINHLPVGKDTELKNIMVMLDLCGFIEDKERKTNFKNILKEIKNLYPEVEEYEVLHSVRDTLSRIYGNLIYYVTLIKASEEELEYAELWHLIIDGLLKQVNEITVKIEKEK